jgi:hypothetical protein
MTVSMQSIYAQQSVEINCNRTSCSSALMRWRQRTGRETAIKRERQNRHRRGSAYSCKIQRHISDCRSSRAHTVGKAVHRVGEGLVEELELQSHLRSLQSCSTAVFGDWSRAVGKQEAREILWKLSNNKAVLLLDDCWKLRSTKLSMGAFKFDTYGKVTSSIKPSQQAVFHSIKMWRLWLH